MDQLLIWVDENDEVIGYGEKLETHRREQLHRAFSVFVYDGRNDRVLLQKRASGKYHSGGKWSNACCSHQRRGEAEAEALRSRLREELGLDVGPAEIESVPSEGNFCYMGKFTYYAPFDGLAEHEVDRVFVYRIPRDQEGQLMANPEEAEELKWVARLELEQWLQREPQAFSAWFSRALELAWPAMEPQGGVQPAF